METICVKETEGSERLVKLVAKGGIIIFAGSLIGKALKFLFYIILVRMLGASIYGLYSLGQSMIDILTNVAALGDGKGFIRFASSHNYDNDKARLKGMVRGYIAICVLLAIIIAAFLFSGAGFLSVRLFHNRDLTGVLKIFALSFPFYIFALTMVPIGYAFNKMEYKVILQEVMLPLVNIIAIVLIFALGGRLYGAVAGFFMSSVIIAIAGFYLLRRLYPNIMSGSKSVFEAKKLISYSLPLLGIVFCYYLIFRLDRLILGVYRTPLEVGIYSIASNTAIGIVALSNIFESAFAPVIAQLYHANQIKELRKMYNCVTLWGTSLNFMPCVVLIIFNREIIALFGKDLNAAQPILIMLSIAFLIEIIFGQTRHLFQMSSHQNMEFINSIIMAALNGILNLIFIPYLGAMGAALSFFLTMTVISVSRAVELRLFFGFSPFNTRYLKSLAYILFAVFISLSTAAIPIVILKLLIAVLILLFYILLIVKNKSEEDVIVWDALRARLNKFNFINAKINGA